MEYFYRVIENKTMFFFGGGEGKDLTMKPERINIVELFRKFKNLKDENTYKENE